MHPSPVLRPAVPADALDVATVHVRSWQEGYRGLMSSEALAALRPEDRAPHYRFDGAPDAPLTTVAVDDGVITGFVTVHAADPDGAAVGRVMALYVDPDAWGQGVGRSLLAEARQRLSDAGCSLGELWVLDGNDRAAAFYRSDEWAPDGRSQRDTVWGVDVVERCFTRRLP